jgi:hypothetical protein
VAGHWDRGKSRFYGNFWYCPDFLIHCVDFGIENIGRDMKGPKVLTSLLWRPEYRIFT